MSAPSPPPVLKNMYHFYMDVLRNEVKDLEKRKGIAPGGPLEAADLTSFDQYHYQGTDAVDHAAEFLGVTQQSRIADVGAGVGGPARHLAQSTKCQVVCFEIQDELVEEGSKLVERCGLKDQMSFVCGDVLDPAVCGEDCAFDGIMSFLVILHIPDRKQCWDRLFKLIKPGGKVFVEDFYLRKELTDGDKRDLANTVSCTYLPFKDEYIKHMTDSGFTDVTLTDMTDVWTAFVDKRSNTYDENIERHIEINGKEIAAAQQNFFTTIKRLFTNGNLGGCRVTATKPL
eukprot:GFYU01003214.1.p1 GENE.GFYU01003214.1~~GFYU01003214.1.p1  ORF type:complete len:286 (+),score=77.26 GFYU01003214.1:60-917(+)